LGPQIIQHFRLPIGLLLVDGPIQPSFHSQSTVLGQQIFALLWVPATQLQMRTHPIFLSASYSLHILKPNTQMFPSHVCSHVSKANFASPKLITCWKISFWDIVHNPRLIRPSFNWYTIPIMNCMQKHWCKVTGWKHLRLDIVRVFSLSSKKCFSHHILYEFTFASIST